VIYSTTTAALLWPRVGAIRFDALAAANRPGRHGLWQRPLERRRLGEATLLLAQSEGALAEVPSFSFAKAVLVLPVPVDPSSPPDEPAHGRDIAVLTYAANPAKKGLDVLLGAWARARRPGEELVIAGVAETDLRAQGYAVAAAGVRVAGVLPAQEYRALLRRARVYVCAARREDYGLAQLEALADGCQLVTVPSPGPYVALPLARQLDARLVGEDLASGLRTALDDPAPGYAERAAAALAPFRREAVDRLVSGELLPRFLGQPGEVLPPARVGDV
jgi:glycosyltransferase involved in cell wall biosynthesis